MKFFSLILLLSFSLGIAFSSVFKTGTYFSLFGIFLSAILFLYFYLFKKTNVQENLKIIYYISVFIFVFALGTLRFNISELKESNSFLDNKIGEKIEVEAVVFEEPDERENSIRLVADFKNFLDGDKKIKVEGRGLIVTGLYPKFNYGDLLKITGKLEKPKNFKNEDGSESDFDYVSYLAKDGIVYEMAFPKIEIVSHGNGNFLKEKLFALKNIFTGKLQSLIPEPESALLGGLLLGEKQSLGKELQDDFRKAGIVHIVVLSGYNITIVADSIMRSLSFLPKFFNVSLGALSIVLFGIMTGGSATVVRSCIMSLLVIFAKATGRTYQVTRALFIAGFLMIIQNPKILVFDPSFQLSFMATFGLIFFSPLIEKRFSFIPEKFHLKELSVSTITTQIFLLPMLLNKMGTLSLVALPVNLLVLCFIPITMLFGFLSAITGFLNHFLALPFSYIAYFLLHYEISVVRFFSSLPFASLEIKYFPFWLMVLVYIFYGFVIWKYYPTKQK